MVVSGRKEYRLKYGGEMHTISRSDLEALNDKLAAQYKHADELRRKKICDTLIKLNGGYIKNSPYKFFCEMDREDFHSEIMRFIPQALMAYESSLGHFHTYLASWKHAAFSKYLDSHRTVRLPQSQRHILQKLNRKIAKGIELKEKEIEVHNQLNFSIGSLNISAPDGPDQWGDQIPGDDPRERFHEMKLGKLWERIREALENDKEFQVFYWRLHEDHQLQLEEIGNRIGVSRERVRQIFEKAKTKVRRRFKSFSFAMEL